MQEDDDQNIGFQDPDEEMPSEMKDHALAAFQHLAGLGPHPGMYTGPTKRKGAADEPTETDLQSAREEPISGEASAKKMRAAMSGGGDLGPTQIQTQQASQATALQRQATTQGAQAAQQAQAQSPPLVPPQAPGGAAGESKPFPAQAGPQPVPPAQPPQPMPPAAPPAAPGQPAPQEG